MAADTEGNVLLAHASLGRVIVLGPQGAMAAAMLSCRGATITNLAFGGPGSRRVFATESATGSILVAGWRAAGLPLAG